MRRMPSGKEWVSTLFRLSLARDHARDRNAGRSGPLSKQIAHDIGIAEATVKVHRSRAMQKMQAGSLPELGRMASRLKLVPDTPQRS